MQRLQLQGTAGDCSALRLILRDELLIGRQRKGEGHRVNLFLKTARQEKVAPVVLLGWFSVTPQPRQGPRDLPGLGPELRGDIV